MKPKTIAIVVGIVVLFAVLFSWNKIFPGKPVATLADPSNLPGLQTGAAPWNTDLPNLAARLHAIGLPALSAEGAALHIHQHLDLIIDGQPVPVPPGIGINAAAGFISDIHVHDATGVIHVESPTVQTFTLGQFFDIWGVRFTQNCIGGYCADSAHTLAVYADGKPYTGDLRSLPLTSHEEIAIVYGAASSTSASIPSSYTFSPGE